MYITSFLSCQNGAQTTHLPRAPFGVKPTGISCVRRARGGCPSAGIFFWITKLRIKYPMTDPYVCHIWQHLPSIYPKCWHIYHTWILWEWYKMFWSNELASEQRFLISGKISVAHRWKDCFTQSRAKSLAWGFPSVRGLDLDPGHVPKPEPNNHRSRMRVAACLRTSTHRSKLSQVDKLTGLKLSCLRMSNPSQQ